MMETELSTIKKQQADRLELIREQTGLNQSDFAKYLDLEPGSYSDIKRGKNGISRNILSKLEKKLSVSISWLLNNEGPMKREDSSSEISNTENLLIPAYGKIPSESTNAYINKLFNMIDKKDEQINKKDEQIKDLLQTIKNLLHNRENSG